jgi:hypothetical protein
VGRTNTNVVQHACSRCRNIRPIHDFPHPEVAWWCRDCWQKSREKQNEKRRQKRQAALEQYIFKPRPPSWRFERYKSKGGLAVLSPLQRYWAQTEYNKLIEKCKRDGVSVTPKKSASLWANAIYIVMYVRTGKMRSWLGNNRRRKNQWERLQEKQKTEEFRAKPLSQRCKVLSCG